MRGEARRAKKEVALVMRDLSSVVRGREERSLFMEMSVEDMTPVLEDVSFFEHDRSIHIAEHSSDAFPAAHAPRLQRLPVVDKGRTYSYPNNNPLTPAHSVRHQTNTPGRSILLSSTSPPVSSSSSLSTLRSPSRSA